MILKQIYAFLKFFSKSFLRSFLESFLKLGLKTKVLNFKSRTQKMIIFPFSSSLLTIKKLIQSRHFCLSAALFNLAILSVTLAPTALANNANNNDSGIGDDQYNTQSYDSQACDSQSYSSQSCSTSGTVTNIPQDGCSNSCCPRFPVGLIFDRTSSEWVGASIFISLLRGYQALDDMLLPNSEGDHSAYTILGRFGKLVIEDVIFSTGMVAQHEVFGHGARAREFKVPVLRYQVLPYSGYTQLSYKYNFLTPNEKIAIDAAGMEATGILAKRIRDYWLASKFIDEREAHLYVLNALDQPLYALNTRREPYNNIHNSNDISSYVAQINQWYGHQVLSVRRLRQLALFDFLDPYLYYSFFSMGMYIVEGVQCWEYPMIPIGDYQYLPGFRIALAPYGPETQFINYIRSAENTIQARFRYGHTDQRKSWGAGVEITRFWSSDLINLDAKLEIWNQPRLFKANAGQATPKFGAGLWGTLRWCVFSQVELLGQVGYKSSGYVPAEPLKSGPIFRAGFNLNI